MIMMEWVLMMELATVLTSVVTMGLWLVWRREETVGMWKDIEVGNQEDDMVVKMMVVVTAWWMDWMLETERVVVVGQVRVKV